MTLTTKTARKQPTGPTTVDDHALCSVDVTVGRAVYWDGEQREGSIKGVPKHVAMEWLKAGHVRTVHEPKSS